MRAGQDFSVGTYEIDPRVADSGRFVVGIVQFANTAESHMSEDTLQIDAAEAPRGRGTPPAELAYS